jgi:hypothetical protein
MNRNFDEPESESGQPLQEKKISNEHTRIFVNGSLL